VKSPRSIQTRKDLIKIMPDKENSQVFGSNTLTSTATRVPDAGGDNHLTTFNNSLGSYPAVTNQSFVSGQGAGQQQHSVRSGDHTNQVADNQYTIVIGEISISSQTNQIVINAATRIELHVGASKLVMDKDGNITLTGKTIKIEGTSSTEVVAPNNHIGGTTKLDGGDVFIN
jgi:type VI secretion system secreted protein VgrG